MALEETTIAGERVEVLADGSLQVRDAIVILRDGMRDPIMPPRYHRYVLQPGEGLTGKPERVAAIANAVWTEEVVRRGLPRNQLRTNRMMRWSRGCCHSPISSMRERDQTTKAEPRVDGARRTTCTYTHRSIAPSSM